MNAIDPGVKSYPNKASDGLAQDQLITDFKVVLADAEALIKATANQGSEKLDEVRARARESLRVVNARLSATQDAVIARTREAAQVTDAYVHNNPWMAIGVASSVSLLVGLLLGRR